MRPEDILRAMNDLDQDLVAEAKRGESKPHIFRKVFILAAAIMLFGGLALSAVAAEGSGWLLKFFSRNGASALTAEQMELIENGTVNLGQAQTNNGYTLALECAFTDGRKTFFQFLLTVPDGVELDADWYGDSEGCVIVSEEGEDFIEANGLKMGGFCWRHHAVEGAVNKLILIFETESFYLPANRELSGKIWNVQIEGLACGYLDYEYGLKREKLTDGTWTFAVTFPDNCQRQIDFVQEPVEVLAALGVGARFDPDDGTISFIEEESKVLLTSFDIRALTAELTFSYAERESINGDFGDIYAVMKNGEKILLIPAGVAPNYLTFCFDSPVVLDEVAYILLRDGTILRP